MSTKFDNVPALLVYLLLLTEAQSDPDVSQSLQLNDSPLYGSSILAQPISNTANNALYGGNHINYPHDYADASAMRRLALDTLTEGTADETEQEETNTEFEERSLPQMTSQVMGKAPVEGVVSQERSFLHPTPSSDSENKHLFSSVGQFAINSWLSNGPLSAAFKFFVGLIDTIRSAIHKSVDDLKNILPITFITRLLSIFYYPILCTQLVFRIPFAILRYLRGYIFNIFLANH